MDNSILTLYLAPFGYAAASAEEWRSPQANDSRPSLNLDMKGHHENGGHTLYDVECRLVSEALSLDLEWQASHRLKYFREDLHCTVKNELGRNYDHIFASAPFAKKGGFIGTSERLQKWLIMLAAIVNDGRASPALVAQLLLFLHAPAQSGHRKAAQTVDDVEPEVCVSKALGAHRINVHLENEIGNVADAGVLKGNDVKSHGLEADISSRKADCQASLTSENQFGLAEIRPMEWIGGQTEDSSSPGGLESSADELVADDICGASCARGFFGAKNLGTEMYLQSYGYEPSTATEWSVPPKASWRKPQLTLGIDGHVRKDSHRLYSVHCKLVTQESMLNQEWLVQRRLTSLQNLHTVVKEGVGERYFNLFASTPFARRGITRGTTNRLKAWLPTVADCVNDGIAEPALVAHILTFLDAPPLGPWAVPDAHPTERASQNGMHERMSVAEATPQLRSTPLVFDMSSDDGELEATDDENASVWTWSLEKRRAGFTKLRDWFVDLKRRFERSLKS